jgi:hypothetical protein
VVVLEEGEARDCSETSTVMKIETIASAKIRAVIQRPLLAAMGFILA